MPKHHVVVLDGLVPLPPLDFEYDLTQHNSTSVDDLPSRVKDATIIITSVSKITRAGIENAPNLQLVATNGAGLDHIDQQALRDRGVALCRVPAQNTDSVSEHAFALYYTIRRQIVPMHDIVMRGEAWQKERMLQTRFASMPRVNGDETLVIVGYGALGKNIEKIATALGMKVLIAERKGATMARPGRILFEDALKQGTVFIIVAPLDDSTRNMFSTAEFEAMDSTALVVNVGRGGLVKETELVKALREGKIGGAATDVFEHEPATKVNCPLLDPSIPNLVLSPHIACTSMFLFVQFFYDLSVLTLHSLVGYSSRTIRGTLATIKANIEGFVAEKPQNIIIQEGKDCPQS